ncbi:hypothetical protein HJFPF1_13456 [Paramyrothecium foliicola]|nr:hypothetical protein HJFPF1_13456 [Paramyrothecium foliicola]
MVSSLLPTHEEVMANEALRFPMNDPCRLVLYERNIFAEHEPEKLLYALNEPPADADSSSYCLNKIKYRQAKGKTTTKVSNLYDIKDPFDVKNYRNPALIKGRAGGDRTYAEVTLEQGENGWSSCSTVGWFSAFREADGIRWYDAYGNRVATEIEAPRDKDEELTTEPRLVIEIPLNERDFDLLVACWVARVWKESQKALHRWKNGKLLTRGSD